MQTEALKEAAATPTNDRAGVERDPELQRLDDAWVKTCRRKGWVDRSFAIERPSARDNNPNGWLFLLLASACFAPWIKPDATSDAERWTATIGGILFIIFALVLFLVGPRRPKRFDEQERSYREKRDAILVRLGGEARAEDPG
jgi:hypothetical protein